jgi:hypothetical protein
VVVAEFESGRVIYVNADGFDRQIEFPQLTEFSAINDIKISPDGTYLIFAGFAAGETGVYVGNLEAEECCVKLPDPIPAGATFASVGAFNADGTQVAATLSRTFAAEDDAASLSGFVVAYDLTDGSIGGVVSVQDFPEATPETLGAYLGAWSEAGIVVLPTCMNCERPTKGQAFAWNPADDVIGEGGFLDVSGQKLLATDEIVTVERDEAFPISETILGNVIRYYDSSNADVQPVVIYNNQNNLAINSANWVLDGTALLVNHIPSTDAYLLFRDGNLARLALPENNAFLVGLPDGWLARSEGKLLYYQLDGSQLNTFELGEVTGQIALASQTPLGNAELSPFPALEQAPAE